MKKPLVILLCSCYFIIASGIALNIHYCGGKIKEISLFKISEEGCCGSEEESSGCCDDGVAFFKIKDDQRFSIPFIVSYQCFLTGIINTELATCRSNDSFSNIPQNYHSPPVFYDNPKYLKHKVFLI